MVSIGGADEKPYSLDPGWYGSNCAAFANQNYLDGVDFDLENLNIGVSATSCRRRVAQMRRPHPNATLCRI